MYDGTDAHRLREMVQFVMDVVDTDLHAFSKSTYELMEGADSNQWRVEKIFIPIFGYEIVGGGNRACHKSQGCKEPPLDGQCEVDKRQYATHDGDESHHDGAWHHGPLQ